MSKNKYRPKLFIDTKKLSSNNKLGIKEDDIYNETDKYSITPRTFESRKFFEKEPEFFYDTYSFKKSSVERFGLNIHSKELLKSVNDYNNTKKTPFDLKSLTSVKTNSNKSKVINKNIKIIKDYIQGSKKILTKLEMNNTKNAIKYLNDNKEKAVLIDIFERDVNNDIAMDNKLPKIHAVVLYEKQGKYLVIDPSNATFSHILAGVHEDIRLCFNKKLQIYKIPETDLDGNKINAKIGSKFSEWRDCIDIAAKLAFNLQINYSKLKFDDDIKVIELDTKNNIGYIDANSLKENHSIQTITNQTNIFNKLYYKVKTEAMRVKQSSDVVQNKKATVLLTTLESVTSNLNKILEEKKHLHSLKILNKKEEKLAQKIFLEQDYKKLLQNEMKYFSDILDPYYSIVKDEVEILAKNEFDQIDKQLN